MALLGCGSNDNGGGGGGDTPDAGHETPTPIGPIDLGPGGETQMAVSGNRLLTAWIGQQGISYALSLDRGATFSYNAMIHEAGFGDPIAAAAPDGSLFVGGLGGCTSGCIGRIVIARSAKDAMTFEPGVNVDSRWFVDHPWLTTATDGRLTIIFNPRDVTTNPPSFRGSGMTAATSQDGKVWEQNAIVPLMADRNAALATSNGDGTESYALFYDSAAPYGQVLEKSADGKMWAPTATFPGRIGPYTSDAVRAASRGADIWLLSGLAGDGGSETTTIVYHQGLALIHSADGGATWQEGSTAVSDGRLYMLPELSIEPSGALDVLYYAATRDLDPAATFEWVRSTDAGATWSAPVVLDQKILFQRSRLGRDWLGDYVATTADADYVYFMWTGNQSGQSAARFARRPMP
jgi:hypothetical protein